MHDRDCLHRFLFEHYPIRGHVVHLDASWRALLKHRDYPAAIRDTLGEAVAASVLLAATLKFDGTLSLQLQGRGPMRLMLAQCSSQLGVRAVARFDEDAPIDARPGGADQGMAQGMQGVDQGAPQGMPRPGASSGDARYLARLSGEGTLAVTLETEDLSQRYQGVVPLIGERLADCLRGYFEQSEQLPTRLWLHATQHGASGLLLQRLSDDTVKSRASGECPHGSATLDPLEIEDAWQRVQLLGDTLKPQELGNLGAQDILRRLFAEDDVRLFEPAPVFFRCRCSRDRVIGMLQALGADEVRSVLAEQGEVEVRCDFCNRAYQFDAVDVEQLLAAGSLTGGGETRH